MVMEALTTSAADCEISSKLARSDARPVQWIISPEPVPYPLALETMRARAG